MIVSRKNGELVPSERERHVEEESVGARTEGKEGGTGVYICHFDEKHCFIRRKKSLLSLTDRTLSWRTPGPGSVIKRKKKTKSDERA